MANQAKQRKIEKSSCVGLKERIVELERQLEFYKKTYSETERLAVVVKDSNDAITVQDLQGNITAWNYGAERIYGYTEAEALQTNIFQIIPKDKKREALHFFKSIKNGEIIESFETQRLTKEGKTLDVWLTVTPLRDSKGKLRAIATTERDITDRKQAEEEREKLIIELQTALSEIKTLRGLLPICMNCHKIRTEHGAWNKLETYISEHSDAEFSHGICPDCFDKQMKDIEKES